MKKLIITYLSIIILILLSYTMTSYALDEDKKVNYNPVTKNLEYTVKNVTKATTTTKYKIIGLTVNYNSKKALVKLEPFLDNEIGNGLVDVPLVVPSRSGSGSVLERLRKVGVPDDQLIDLFSKNNTLYLDGIMTISENGRDLATMNSDGTFTGSIDKDYFTTSVKLKSAREWRVKSDIDKFFGLWCPITGSNVEDTVLKSSLANPTAHISKGNSIVDNSTVSYMDNDVINLLGDKSIFPSYADGMIYKWEYKPVSSSTWSTISEGESKVSPTFPKLGIGNYDVRLTVWYRVGSIVYSEKTSSAQVTLNISQSPEGAYITAEVSCGPDILVTQEQIDANEVIPVKVTIKATIHNFTDINRIAKWTLYLRKNPAGPDDQLEKFDFTTNLGLTAEASKVFNIPAAYLKDKPDYTQMFAGSATITLK